METIPCFPTCSGKKTGGIKASKIKSLPRNLLEAIEKLQHDDFAKEALGESMLNQFFAYKMDEWDRYHQAVSDWEVTEYLRLY